MKEFIYKILPPSKTARSLGTHSFCRLLWFGLNDFWSRHCPQFFGTASNTLVLKYLRNYTNSNRVHPYLVWFTRLPPQMTTNISHYNFIYLWAMSLFKTTIERISVLKLYDCFILITMTNQQWWLPIIMREIQLIPKLKINDRTNLQVPVNVLMTVWLNLEWDQFWK